MRVLQKRSDHRLDDDAALLSMAREILGGPGDCGRASYQVVLTQCEDCGRGFQHASGELIQLDPAIVEMCHCDAQTIAIGATAASNAPTSRREDDEELTSLVTPAGVDGPVVHDGVHVGAVCEVVQSNPHVGSVGEVAQSNAHVGAVCDVARSNAHVGSVGEVAQADCHAKREAAGPSAKLKRQRATQDTPPAIRREVFWRDRGRCVVPGCRNATYVDLHHLELRSEGGSNDPDNLVVLCGAHHGALHRGRLRIDGKVSTGLRVRHADGTAYGFMPSPLLADASARAFAGLRNLGFSERTARANLEYALANAPADATAETLLRSAVARASRH